jgi:N-acetylneuraminate synthase
MKSHIKIDDKSIGADKPCFVIAEVAQAHDGSLGFAHSYIDAVSKTGADAIKFQTHIAAAESSPDEPFRVNFSYEDSSRYDYWKRMEFSALQWEGLSQHCKDVGLIFLSSAFSLEAVELLSKLGMPAWKVGSGEVNNPLILEAMAQAGNPILLSSGMSDWNEIDTSFDKLCKLDVPIAMFQCTSKYPTSFVDVGLNIIEEMRTRYGVPVGLSDHSGSTHPSLAAIANKADLLEVHVVFDHQMFGPDTKASVTHSQLKDIIAFRDNFYLMNANPVDKDQMANNLSDMRALFNKSIILAKTVYKGTVITRECLTLKKPGVGLPSRDIDKCVGKTVNKTLDKDYFLKWEDLED